MSIFNSLLTFSAANPYLLKKRDLLSTPSPVEAFCQFLGEENISLETKRELGLAQLKKIPCRDGRNLRKDLVQLSLIISVKVVMRLEHKAIPEMFRPAWNLTYKHFQPLATVPI
ncbi:predicted protein [Sclerotinia sclerotiorum 1980 UF-70]|uniref:Uncharacterized protein n=1 Tax=Sclerotinia sclerotiorum (strain ATCC 18683 / 1980 / Ss-1) TaxID=665079 RepID=A7F660_SCLS1|nr:predicted protein [Sclerotinia sclerotiorum 1980 UF-70]EDN98231.1 predicted protein [Sclerotinia sclerotiorum 1980 UF-70]